MLRDSTRSRRALTAACVLFVTVSAANASLTFERPRALDPALAQLSASAGSDGSDSQQLSTHRLLIAQAASTPPRVAEARASLDLWSLERSQVAPRCELAEHGREDRLASRSGCAATTRWCRAHATSTQAP